MKLLKKFLATIVLVPLMAVASEGGFPLDRAPDRSNDLSALQNGARLFVNYCLNCHSASLVRYNRLRDIGLSDDQVRANLLFTADYVYTYLRTYYKDDSRATGWNNLVYPNVAMPHVLWDLQGVRKAKFVEEKDPHDPSKTIHKFDGFEQLKAGKLSSQAYDAQIADLVGFMSWMSEPIKNKRQQLGVWVLLFMSILVFLTWRLNASFWKEVK